MLTKLKTMNYKNIKVAYGKSDKVLEKENISDKVWNKHWYKNSAQSLDVNCFRRFVIRLTIKW